MLVVGSSDLLNCRTELAYLFSHLLKLLGWYQSCQAGCLLKLANLLHGRLESCPGTELFENAAEVLAIAFVLLERRLGLLALVDGL